MYVRKVAFIWMNLNLDTAMYVRKVAFIWMITVCAHLDGDGSLCPSGSGWSQFVPVWMVMCSSGWCTATCVRKVAFIWMVTVCAHLDGDGSCSSGSSLRKLLNHRFFCRHVLIAICRMCGWGENVLEKGKEGQVGIF